MIGRVTAYRRNALARWMRLSAIVPILLMAPSAAILPGFPAPMLLLFLSAALAFGAERVATYDKQVRDAEVTLAGDTLQVGPRAIPVRGVRAGWKTAAHTLVLQLAAGDELHVAIGGEPNDLLRALGLDVDQRALEAPLRRVIGAFTMGLGTFTALVLVSVFAAAFARSGWVALGGVAVGAALAVLVARRFGTPRILVGADGLRLTGVLRPRFIPYSAIVHVTEAVGAVHVRLADGGDLVLPTIGQSPAQVAALVTRAREGMRRYVAARPIALLARAGRPIAAWRDDLRRLVLAEGSFRVAAIPREELEAALADATAPADVRVGAALALREIDAEAAEPRIRQAAQASADLRVRVALETVASDGELERALEDGGATGAS